MDEKLIPVFSKKILPYYGYYLENRFVLTSLCKKTYDHYMWHKHLYGKHTLGWHPTIVEIDSFDVEQSEQTRSKILGSYCYLNFTLDWDKDLDKFIRFYKDLKVAEVKTPHGSHPLLGVNSRVYLVNVIYKTRDSQCLKFQPKLEEDPFGPTPETQIVPLKVPKNHVFSTNPDLEASGDQVTPQHLSMYQQFLAYGTKYLQESGMLDFFYKEFRGVQNTDSNRCGEFYYISFQPYYHNLFASLRPMKITGRCIIIPKRDFYYYYLTSPQTIPADYLKTVQEVMLHSENFNQGNLCNFMKNITFEKK